jgi:hypothetical protein
LAAVEGTWMPPALDDQGQGESVGRYQGGTLVIDTIGQKVGPLSMIDRYGTPFSAALQVVERCRLIDGPTARDRQQKHESVYFSAGRSAPPINVYGRGDIDPDPAKPGLQVEIKVDDRATRNRRSGTRITTSAALRRCLPRW